MRMDRSAKVFQTLCLQDDVIDFMQRREQLNELIVRIGIPHIDDELLLGG